MNRVIVNELPVENGMKKKDCVKIINHLNINEIDSSNEFVSCANVGDKTLREGSIGKIAGLDVLVSTNLSASNGIVNILAGTNDAITFASQVSKIETIRDKDSFSDLVRGLYVYGAKTVLPKALAKLTVSLTSTTVETTNTGT